MGGIVADLSEPLGRLYAEAEEVARHLEQQPFPALACAIRSQTDNILERWRQRSIQVLPDLDRLTIAEFGNSISEILAAMAAALERPESESVRRFIEASPAHGSARFAQHVEPHVMLAEERLLRSAIVLELREALGRPLSAEEAAAFHELFDLMGEYSLLRLIQARREVRDKRILEKVSGIHRLADLGTLAAGLAHDAANLMLPIRMRLEFLSSAQLPPEAQDDVEGLLLLIDQLQDFITNLRMLSVDPHRRGEPGGRHAAEGRERAGGRGNAAIDLSAWWDRVKKFHRRMLPYHLELKGDVPADLPRVAVPAPVLSQALFNLIRNSHNAMQSQSKGCITIHAAASADGGAVDLTVEDDGPGMTPDVMAHCFEPFFSAPTPPIIPALATPIPPTEEWQSGMTGSEQEQPAPGQGLPNGSGLGLAIVSTMVRGAGGRVSVQSPPPGKPRGARFVLSLPVA
jgi:signal transduction histidine kinase